MDWLALKHRDALPKTFWSPAVDTSTAATFLDPHALRPAKINAYMWLAVGALMIFAMIVSLVRSRVTLRRAWAKWAQGRGLSIAKGIAIEEKTDDGIALKIGLKRGANGAGLQTQMRCSTLLEEGATDRLARFRAMLTSGTEDGATELLSDDVRRALTTMKSRAVGLDYGPGLSASSLEVVLTWPGADPDPALLEAGRELLIALARAR